MATRAYIKGRQIFSVRVAASEAGNGHWAWTVVDVFEGDEEVAIPGIESIVAEDEETAFRKAFEQIDKAVPA